MKCTEIKNYFQCRKVQNGKYLKGVFGMVRYFVQLTKFSHEELTS